MASAIHCAYRSSAGREKNDFWSFWLVANEDVDDAIEGCRSIFTLLLRRNLLSIVAYGVQQQE